MITISLCMIVKNEENVLGRCLESVKDAVEEIVIVDTGSTDRTKEIARQYTDRVYDFQWIQDFSAARNFAFSKGTKEYLLWLDADDVLPPAQREKLIELKKTLPREIDIVTMKYHTAFDEAGNPVFTSTRERLLKREKDYCWQDPIHEYILLTGKIYYSDISISHKPEKEEVVSTRNLDIYNALLEKGAAFSPRQQYYYARELSDHGMYDRAAEYYEGFLDAGKGWQEDNITSCMNLARCYRALGRKEEILPTLFRSFGYDTPRGEICCEIGYYYLHSKAYKKALDWFQIAVHLAAPDSIGFILEDYWGYVPYLESCVCCCHMGQFEKAWEYNEKAGEYKPKSRAVLQNREYLKSMLGK